MAEEKNAVDENELSDLLQNTLKDFCKIYDDNKSPKQEPKSSKDGEPDQTGAGDDGQGGSGQNSDPFMKLYDSDPQFRDALTHLVKSCNEPVNDGGDLHESLLSSLNEISQKAMDIGSKTGVEPGEEQFDLAKMVAAINGDESVNPDDLDLADKENALKLNQIMPLMSNIMENLLSKEFLYPTLADLKLKYPEYLTENQEIISKDDLMRYKNQYEIIVKICTEFENESTNDDQNVKTKRFNRILALMQTMQSFGTPPSDLVAGNSFQPPPDMNQQCCII